jgi:hypothetical protein
MYNKKMKQMKSLKFRHRWVALLKVPLVLLVTCFACSCTEQAAVKKAPVIYSSDLYHPYGDPDDHYDLATLFLMPEFDVKAFIFDISSRDRSQETFGRVALEQISAITQRPVPPYADGLRRSLASQDDQAKDQPAEHQGAVELILKTLRESEQKVLLFAVGSCRDFAAAYNREPELLRKKVSAVYISAGNGPDGKQNEANVGADHHAYFCMMTSGLPIYWCPCIPRAGYVHATKADVEAKNDMTYNTYFTIPNQAELLKKVPTRLRNFFNYAFTLSTEAPIPYLDSSPEEQLPNTIKGMWSTPAFFHAAGRKIYAGQDGNYIACSPREAQKMGISNKEVKVFAFDPIRLSQETDSLSKKLPVLQGDLNVKKSSTQIFHYIHPNYNEIMVSTLATILGTKE